MHQSFHNIQQLSYKYTKPITQQNKPYIFICLSCFEYFDNLKSPMSLFLSLPIPTLFLVSTIKRNLDNANKNFLNLGMLLEYQVSYVLLLKGKGGWEVALKKNWCRFLRSHGAVIRGYMCERALCLDSRFLGSAYQMDWSRLWKSAHWNRLSAQKQTQNSECSCPL